MTTISSVIRTHAAERPDAVALVCGAQSLTWAELDDRSNQVAAALADAGVTVGDRVAVIDKNGPEFWELLFATAKVGAVLVSVNWRLSPLEMAGICRDAQAVVLVVGPEFEGAVAEQEATLTEVRQIVSTAGDGRWPSYLDWSAREGAADPQVELADDDVAIQLYTSGTTGLPKGVMLTHANLAALLPEDEGGTGPKVGAATWASTPIRWCWRPCRCSTSPAADGRSRACRGGAAVLERDVDPTRILDLIAGGVTHAFLVPVVLQVLTAMPGAATATTAGCATSSTAPRPSPSRCCSPRCGPSGREVLPGLRADRDHRRDHPAEPADHDPGGPRAHLLRARASRGTTSS